MLLLLSTKQAYFFGSNQRMSLNCPTKGLSELGPARMYDSSGSSDFYCCKTNNILDFNFKMKTETAYLQPKFGEEPILPSVNYSDSAVGILQKGEKRLKKDYIKEKKRMKNEEMDESKAKNIKCDLPNDKSKSDEDHSVTTQDSDLSKSRISPNISLNRPAFHLDKLVSKPPYITVTQINKIMGDYGHGTAVFKRPFVEGSYFMEFTVKQDCKRDKKIKFKSAIRVGIVRYDYNTSFAIGCDESLAYKSNDGSFVRNGEKIEHREPYGVGDVIGMVVKINSPKKDRNAAELQEGSSVSFFKNGKLVYQFSKLKQTFYCFAVGFYNYSQVEVNLSPKSIFPMCSEAKQYWSVLNEKIPYSDLQQLKIFKI